MVYLPLGREHLSPEEFEEKGERRKEKEVDSLQLTVDSNTSQVTYHKSHITSPEPETHLTPLTPQPPFPPLLEERGPGGEVQQTTKPLLLIVEDNTDLRSYIRGYLDESYKVVEAVNGKEGLEKALEQIPDLILSDVMMPEMDGFELCGKLKSDPLTCHIPVVLLTARDAIESKIEGLETGADDYLAKPFEPKELQVRIRNLIEQRQRLREKFSSDLTEGDKESLLQIPLASMGEMDKTFIMHALEVVEQQMTETDFDVVSFSSEMSLSRQQLHRKLKALTGLSPTEFIRTIRLNKAASLLASHSGTVSEIAYDVGFNSLSYFSKCFQEQFGITPSEYMEKRL